MVYGVRGKDPALQNLLTSSYLARQTMERPNTGAPAIWILDPRPLFRKGLFAAFEPVSGDHRRREASEFSELNGVAGAHIWVLTELSLVEAQKQGVRLLDHLNQNHCKGAILLIESHGFAARFAAHPKIRLLNGNCELEHLVTTLKDLLKEGGIRPGREACALAKMAVEPPAQAINCGSQRIHTLTTMQYRVLELIGQGLLNKQIAYQCSISEATVKSHASEVFRKLHIRRRSEAAVLYTKMIVARAPAGEPYALLTAA